MGHLLRALDSLFQASPIRAQRGSLRIGKGSSQRSSASDLPAFFDVSIPGA